MNTQLQIGDIVEWSGGYNCTRTDFYKIVSFNKSGKKALAGRLSNVQVTGDWMNGAITAGDYVGTDTFEFMVKPVNGNYSTCTQMLRGRGEYSMMRNFYKWDGKPVWNNCD